jgi:hypothetical protein
MHGNPRIVHTMLTWVGGVIVAFCFGSESGFGTFWPGNEPKSDFEECELTALKVLSKTR